VIGSTPTSHNFGNLNLGQTANQIFTLDNIAGSGDLNVSSIVLTGGPDFSMSGQNPSETITAGTSSASPITITYAPTTTGAHAGSLTIQSDSGGGSPHILVVNFNGNGTTGVIDSTPTSHNFGNLNLGQSANQVFTLDNVTDSGDLNISFIVLTGGPDFSMSGANPSEVIGAGASSASPITITYAPTTAGAHAGSLTIQSDSGGGSPHVFVINFNGGGTTGIIGSSPVSHDFTQLNLNNPANTVVTLDNSGSGPLTISSITVTGSADFSISGQNPSEVIAAASNSAAPITVTFNPTTMGVHNGTIVVESDSAGGSPHIFNIALTGEGTAPTISIPTPPATFAAQNVNTGTYTQVVAIDNTGNGLLTLNSITLTGSSEFSLQGGIPGSVPAGGSVNVTVEWTPTIADVAQFGTLVISSDSGSTGSPVITNLPYDATATQGELTVPASVNWGPVGLTMNLQANITVDNTGSGPLTVSAATIGGANAANFTWITNPTPVVIASSGSTVFTIEFAPSFVGNHLATLTLTSDELGNVGPQINRVVNLDGDGAPPAGIANLTVSADNGGPSKVSFDITGFVGNAVDVTLSYSGGNNPGVPTLFSASSGTIAGGVISGLTTGDSVTVYWDLYATEGQVTYSNYQLTVDPFDVTLGQPGTAATTASLTFTRQGGFATHDFPGETPKGTLGHVMVYDAVNNNLVVYGGKQTNTRTDELWIYSIDKGSWTPVPQSGLWPPRLQYATAVYDSINHRMIVFSGTSNSGVRDQTWALDLSNNTWSEIATVGKPAARFGAVMAYDAPNGRAIVHGGNNGGYLADTWELDLTLGSEAWTQLTPGGSVPTGRWGHASALDPATPRLVIHGGKTAGGEVDEVHELNLATNTWSAPAVSGAPGTRYFGNSAHDTVQNRLFVSGGYRNGSFLKDAWVLDINTWSWTQTGADPVSGSGRTTAMGAFNASTQTAYFYGGYAYGISLSDLTSLDMSGATPVFNSPDIKNFDASGPEGRWGAVSEFDEINNRLVLFGGKDANRFDGSTWVLDRTSNTGQWSRIVSNSNGPGMRSYPASAMDKTGNLMFMHGGGSAAGTLLNDLWVLNLNTDTWTQLNSGPSARYLHAMVYDTNLNRLILFGGKAPGHLNDVWAYNVGTNSWAPLAPTGTPPSARGRTAQMFDAGGNRMIVAAGETAVGYSNEVWELDLSVGSEAWTDISAIAGSIMPGRGSMAFGDIGSDLWFQGGYNGSSTDEIWTLDTSTTPVTWAQQTMVGAAPLRRFTNTGAMSNAGDFYTGLGIEASVALNDFWRIDTGTLTARPTWIPNAPRSLHTAQVAMDAGNNRLIAFGGLHKHNLDPGLYALDLSTPRASWVGIDAAGDIPQPRRAASFVYDATGNRMVMYGGLFTENSSVRSDELWTLSMALGSETWTMHTNPAVPGLRSHHTAVIDSSNRMWLFGGLNSANAQTNELFELDLAAMTWTTATPSGTPPAARAISTGIFDPVANRIVIYGGQVGPTPMGDCYSLDVSGATPSWVAVAVVGSPPPSVFYHSAVYDSNSHRMLVFGGYNTTAHNSLHSLDLTTNVWSQIISPVATPQERWGHGAGWDAVNNRMVIAGGHVNGGNTSTNSGDSVQVWFWGD
jgi:hypothetical protein